MTVPQKPGRWARVRDSFRGLLYGRGVDRHVKARARIGLAIVLFAAVYTIIAGRLVWFATSENHAARRAAVQDAVATARPDIVDRNGDVLATDVKSPSLFGEPRKLIDVDEAVELLTATLPELDAGEVRERLSSRRGFVWLKREITPEQQQQIHRLGLPGIGFLTENKRVYPNGPTVSHALGHVNIDNQGIAGIEKWLDGRGLADLHLAGFATDRLQKPVQLSVDLRVQHAMRQELMAAREKYKAKAAAGIVSDVRTGEIVAMVSEPDYDPNNPREANDPTRINRLTTGVFEMGSTFKALTLAMALDSGKATLNTTYDARMPLRYGKFSITDTHPLGRSITLSEVFTYSSNIGAARVALSQGVEAHRAFLKKLGQLDRLRTELPESAEPILPKRWGELNTITIAFGHGLSVAPLQAVMGINAVVNGGYLVPPTFMKRSQEEAMKVATRVVRTETSDRMRYLMRLNAEKGTAKMADIKGYYVGGKTGTSEKVVNGRYSKKQVLNSFTAILPADDPRYLVLIMLDEPQALPETHGFITSGWNAVPTGGKVIERIAPLLGLAPRFDLPPADQLILGLTASTKAAKKVKLRDLLPNATAGEVEITGITADSRKVKPGFLFVAIPGNKADGAQFIDKAIAAGAVAVLAGGKPKLPAGVAFAPSDNVRRSLALAAAKLYPRQPKTIAAVTGTSGKTSVAAFTRQIWSALGEPAASVGTVGVVSPKGEIYGSLTTPDPVDLHRTLDELAGEGVTHLALEASSHGLDQHRLDGVRIAAGGFTNLSRDHLDYHPTLEAYLAAKLRLFEHLVVDGGAAVIAADHPESCQVIASAKTRGLKIFTVGKAGETIRLRDATIDGFGQKLTLEHVGHTHTIKLPLVGGFQIENALVAAGLCIATGSDPAAVFAALEKLHGAKGRLELAGHANGAPVFIDYAHKPDALTKALEALRPYVRGKLTVVFGAGGDRDPGKRPMMGEIAARDADRVIVTDDNPRSENPAKIRAAILAAAPGAQEIGDRAQAIRAGIASLQKGDVLLIAGKGHETGQIVGNEVLDFSDHDAVAKALRDIAK